MSLSSLRSFSGAASLATTAFDTARSTLKAMAEAAVPPPGSEAAAQRPGSEAAAETATGDRRPESSAADSVAVKNEVADQVPADKRRSGIRQGVALDAYA